MIVDAQGREVEGGNGVDLTERQRRKMLLQNATIGEVNDIAGTHAKAAMNHLGNQVGPFVLKSIDEAIRGYHDALMYQLMVRGLIQMADVNEINAVMHQRGIDKAERPIQEPEAPETPDGPVEPVESNESGGVSAEPADT